MAIALSGSLILSGSITVSGSIISTGTISMSGSIASASYATNADLLDGLDSTVFTLTSSFAAQTASFTAFTASINSFSASILAQTASLNSFSSSVLTFTGSAATRLGALEAATSSLYSYTSSLNNKTASFATTGSNTFVGNQTISGSILQSGSFTSTGTLTAQTLVVQTVTSSVVYSSGSNIFGNTIGNTQTFTGSVLITGSLALAGAATFTTATNTGITITTPDVVTFKMLGSGGTSTNWGFARSLSAAGDFGIYKSTSVGGDPINAGTAALYFLNTGAATFSGNVTISTAVTPTLSIGNQTGDVGSVLRLVGNNTYKNHAIVSNGSGNGTLDFYRSTTNGGTTFTTPDLTISSTGAATFSDKVGLGGLSTYTQFNIATGNDTQMALGTTSTSQTVGIFFADGPSTNTSNYKWEFGKGTANDFFIYSYSVGANVLSLALSTGAATFSSGIGIGGATATTGGIQFPATAVAIADANNLDDYEEGTWTPTLTTSGGTPPTVVSSSGRYIIIGKLVTIYFKFLLSSASGGSGQLKITNAPFSLNLSTIPAVGFARITDLGLTLNCGFLTGTVINFNKYDGNYAGTDYETVGQVSYYND